MEYNCYVFDSLFGYSSVFRIGKIYSLHVNHYVYVMTLHEDLVNYTSIFKRFFKICKEKLKLKIGVMLLSHKDLHNRELGSNHISQLFDKYYRQHFNTR